MGSAAERQIDGRVPQKEEIQTIWTPLVEGTSRGTLGIQKAPDSDFNWIGSGVSPPGRFRGRRHEGGGTGPPAASANDGEPFHAVCGGGRRGRANTGILILTWWLMVVSICGGFHGLV